MSYNDPQPVSARKRNVLIAVRPTNDPQPPDEPVGASVRSGPNGMMASSMMPAIHDNPNTVASSMFPVNTMPAASATSVRPLTSASSASFASSAPVEQDVKDLIKENKRLPPKGVFFPTFDVVSRMGSGPPEYLKFDQIVEYNLLKKSKEQREWEHLFLLKQKQLLEDVRDSLIKKYDKKTTPGFSRFLFGSYAVYKYLINENEATELYEKINDYRSLIDTIDNILRVYGIIEKNKKVIDDYKERYHITGGGNRHKRTKRVRKGLRRTRVNATERFRR